MLTMAKVFITVIADCISVSEIDRKRLDKTDIYAFTVCTVIC